MQRSASRTLRARCSSALLGALALATLAPFGVAQSALFDAAQGLTHAWKAGGFGSGGAVHAAAHGRFGPDLREGAYFVQDGVLVLANAPGVQRSLLQAATGVTAVASVRAEAPGAQDALLAVGPSGLRLVRFDGPSFRVDSVGGPAWKGARSVTSGDFDGDGEQDAAGIDAGGTQLLVAYSVRGGTSVSVARPSAQPTLALAALDFAGDGRDELVFLRADGVRVESVGGELHFAQAAAGVSGGLLVPVHDALATHERLVVLAELAGGEQLLAVIGPTLEAVFALGAAGLFGADAADLDGDGRDELVLLSTLSSTPYLLPPQESAPTYTPDAVDWIDAAVSADGAPPLLADLDDDGDVDLLLLDPSGPPAAQGALALVPNTTHDAALGRVQLDGEARGELALWSESHVARLTLTWNEPTASFEGFDHLEWTVWLRPASSSHAQPQARCRLVEPLPSGEGPFTTSLRLEQASASLDDEYLIQARLVLLDGSAHLLAGGPTFAGGLTPSIPAYEHPGGALQQVAVLELEGPPLAPLEGAGAFLDGERDDAGIVPLPVPPDFDEDPPLPQP